MEKSEFEKLSGPQHKYMQGGGHIERALTAVQLAGLADVQSEHVRLGVRAGILEEMNKPSVGARLGLDFYSWFEGLAMNFRGYGVGQALLGEAVKYAGDPRRVADFKEEVERNIRAAKARNPEAMAWLRALEEKGAAYAAFMQAQKKKSQL
ncbi:hypothetical protein KBB08_01590 [Candidatus Gracilibacteria bacterium]|nr:hypothetical protein [Candidatus Gracilibacteria bacterium]